MGVSSKARISLPSVVVLNDTSVSPVLGPCFPLHEKNAAALIRRAARCHGEGVVELIDQLLENNFEPPRDIAGQPR